jgi:hypothetical protein
VAQQKIEINKRTLHYIRDIANQIYQRSRKPNANLIMLQAVATWLERQGVDVPYTVRIEETE